MSIYCYALKRTHENETERASETRAEHVCVKFKTKRSTAALRCMQPLSVKREMKERSNIAPRVRRLCVYGAPLLLCSMWSFPSNTRLMMMMLSLFLSVYSLDVWCSFSEFGNACHSSLCVGVKSTFHAFFGPSFGSYFQLYLHLSQYCEEIRLIQAHT